jgi:hypothetical protein
MGHESVFGECEVNRVMWAYDFNVASQMVDERRVYLAYAKLRDENWDLGRSL